VIMNAVVPVQDSGETILFIEYFKNKEF